MPHSLQATLDRLELSGHQFLATFQGISADSWRRRPIEGGWSLEEVAEHVAICEAQVRKLVLEHMTTSPADQAFLAAAAGKDELIEHGLTDPTPRTAPESTRPKGRWATAAELAESFRGNRQRVLDFVRTQAPDAESYGWEHPVFGPLTLRQWLLFQACHVERHTRQMLRMTAPG